MGRSTDILETWLSRLDSQPTEGTIDAAPPGELVGAAYSQVGFWAGQQIAGHSSTVYVASHVYRLRGPLNVSALSVALDRVVERHEVLRTTFVERDGDVLQRINEPFSLGLSVQEVTHALTVEQSVEKAVAEPFDLERGPLLRARLYRCSPSDHTLLLVFHHAVNDAWSMDLLHSEVSQLYGAECAGLRPELPGLEIQFADFAHWQLERLRRGEYAQHLDFWRRHLADAPLVLELPLDRPRPASQSFRGDWHRVQVPSDVAQQASKIGAAHSATQFMVLFAAAAVLLSRWSGQRDLVIGTPVANRSIEQVEQLIGPVANVLPIRWRFGGGQSFSDVVSYARATVLEASRWDDAPFEWLVRSLGIRHSAAWNPIIQTMVTSHQGFLSGFELAGLEIEYLPYGAGDAPRDLTLLLAPADDGVAATVWYATDLFDRSTIAGFAERFVTDLATLVADPEAPLGLDPEPVSRVPLEAAAVDPAATESDGALDAATLAMVADVWQEVLAVPSLDRAADFFDLGGTSIAAMRVCGRLSGRLNVRVPVRSLFENPSLQQFAATITAIEHRESAVSVPANHPGTGRANV